MLHLVFQMGENMDQSRSMQLGYLKNHWRDKTEHHLSKPKEQKDFISYKQNYLTGKLKPSPTQKTTILKY